MKHCETIDVSTEKGEISYILTRKKVKNINLRINSCGEVKVSASKYTPLYMINSFVILNAEFIIESIKKILNKDTSYYDKKYIEGEEFLFLGNRLNLKISETRLQKVFVDGNSLCLHVKSKHSFNEKKTLVNKWYDEMCSAVFEDIVNDIWGVFNGYNIPKPTVTLRKMTSRWGSCTPRKCKITLNKRLIERPKSAIEYVVAHEFAHFLQPNHSKAFYHILDKVMCDWKIRKNGLYELDI